VPEPRHEQQPIVGAVRPLALLAGATHVGVGAQELDDDVLGRERAHSVVSPMLHNADASLGREELSALAKSEVGTGVGTARAFPAPAAQASCVTTRLPRGYAAANGPGWTRTTDQRIMSPLL
jgi:hypothetical protein